MISFHDQEDDYKKPLQAILIAGETLRDAVLNNIKKITIREGFRAYRVNEPVILCCHLLNWATLRKITQVDYTTLDHVSKKEWEADGYTSQEDMLTGLKKFYPDLTLDSCVTIIRWDDLGKL